ncbi:MAG: AAA family ATPase [Candidatus Helarchaeota archaeon]
MKIKSVHLKNWQKHSDLFVTFDDNLNIITGVTDSGKTALYRALEWVFNFSNISENDYRKEGTKETSVKIELDNGFFVERIRSNSINRYVLYGKDVENQLFDSFGKQTPEEIATVLGINTVDIENEHLNLNFANQDEINFLLDSNYSDTFKAQLFNKLTGNEILDKVFKELNRESLRINRELKENENLLEKQKNNILSVSKEYKNIKEKLNKINKIYNKIKEDIEIYEELKKLSECLNKNTENYNEINKKSQSIKIISEEKIKSLKNKANNLIILKELNNRLDDIDGKLKQINFTKQKCIEVDFEKLRKQANNFENLLNYRIKLDKINLESKETLQKIKHLNEIIVSNEKELKEIWKEIDICPMCKQKV